MTHSRPVTGSPARRHRRRAVIIGGSRSGLFTAAFLQKIGSDVDVFERSRVELVGRGAGITTHPELLEALELSGAGTRHLGIEVEKRITIDRRGGVIGERTLRQILTSRIGQQFNRYAKVPIEVSDLALRSVRIGGTFDAHDIDSFCAFLQGMDGVVVTRTPKRIDISRRSPQGQGRQKERR